MEQDWDCLIFLTNHGKNILNRFKTVILKVSLYRIRYRVSPETWQLSEELTPPLLHGIFKVLCNKLVYTVHLYWFNLTEISTAPRRWVVKWLQTCIAGNLTKVCGKDSIPLNKTFLWNIFFNWQAIKPSNRKNLSNNDELCSSQFLLWNFR